MRPRIRSLSNILPKRPLRDDFLARNTIQIRLRACRRPSILSPVKPLRHQTLKAPFRRFNKVPIPWGGPKGTQRNPRVPKGYLRAPSAPLGGMGPRGPLGLYRSHSEWNSVSIEWLLRNDSEIKTMAGKPSESKGFKVLPKPFEDQGGLGSEIMPRWCMGSIGREITKTICTKTDHLVACAAADLK